MRVKAEDKDT